MRHIMIDIETLGTKPGAVIASIGAVAFDPDRGITDTFYRVVDIEDAQRRGLTIDAGTVKWWMAQSSEARSVFSSDTTSLPQALYDLQCFLDPGTFRRIWAKPPTFDIVLLEAAYRACDRPIPWHYRGIRDTRTALELACIQDEPFEGVEHNALDDAKHQAKMLLKALHKLQCPTL